MVVATNRGVGGGAMVWQATRLRTLVMKSMRGGTCKRRASNTSVLDNAVTIPYEAYL